MPCQQSVICLTPKPRGFHIVTTELLSEVPDLTGVKAGMLNLFLQHTSASLSINENADPDVPLDLESTVSAIVPETLPYRHTCEGPDDMPAHVKAAFIGCSLNIPVGSGRLMLGTWQGVYLCEHRNHAGPRTVIATLWGE
ncbi:MAG: secondary thiamine-phosphate synthase enzyme YjbQ [Planctomycetota bacterium]